MTATLRLNCGCGPEPAAGWVNVDVREAPGVVCADVARGLPLDGASMEYAVAMHLLQDLPWSDIAPAMSELRRVLRPGGVLRLGLPDLDRAVEAWRRQDAAYFHVPDEHARSPGAKLITQIIWYGSVRTPFNFEFAQEWLEAAGFHDVQRCAYRETASAHADIVSLDNRPRETLFIEAVA